MTRSAEQLAADEALADAIMGVLRAYDVHDQSMVLTDFVVAYALQGWDADGDSKTICGQLVRDGSVPDYRVLGLLETTAAAIRHEAVWSDDDDD